MRHDAALEPDTIGDNKHGYIIRAVLEILKDGRPRTADEILEEGQFDERLPKTLTRKALYIHITGFIGRQKAAGHPLSIIQDPKNRSFRLNTPADKWPPFRPSYIPPSQAAIDDMVKKLDTTSRGKDPTAFELAACEAFSMLGMLAAHIGGYKAPDATLCAPLGAEAYTAVLECEIAHSGVVKGISGVAEAAQHRETFNTTNAILLGPSFEHFGALDRELNTHRVALWTVDDLSFALRKNFDMWELRFLFNVGRAANGIESIIWQREDGFRKRIGMVARILIDEGWKAQVLFARQGLPCQAPLLTQDSAMMMIDTWLQANGATRGVRRDEVSSAFEYLTNPIVDRAIRVNGGEGIVLISPRDLDPTLFER